MRKGIKILGKVFSVAVLLLIILPMVLSLLLDIPAVQNYVVQKAVRMVSRKLETTVSIDRVDIGLFSKVKVKGFYVEDYQRDTLLYVGSLDAYITGLGIFGGGVVFSRGEISGAKLYLRETPEGEMNIKQIVNRISDPDKPRKGNFRLSLRKASIEGMDLCLERLTRRDPEFGIDFGHMHLYGITAHVSDFTIDGQSIYTTIEAMSARERSGFVLDHFSGRTSTSPTFRSSAIRGPATRISWARCASTASCAIAPSPRTTSPISPRGSAGGIPFSAISTSMSRASSPTSRARSGAYRWARGRGSRPMPRSGGCPTSARRIST